MILLITNYNISPRWIQFIIFLMFYFILIKLHYLEINYNIAECTIEHPTTKQRTVPITEFAPAPRFVRQVSICNVSTINNIKDLLPYLSIEEKQLKLYGKITLEQWKQELYFDIPNLIGGMVKQDGRYIYDRDAQLQFFNCAPYNPDTDPTSGNNYSETLTSFNVSKVAPIFRKLWSARDKVSEVLLKKQ